MKTSEIDDFEDVIRAYLIDNNFSDNVDDLDECIDGYYPVSISYYSEIQDGIEFITTQFTNVYEQEKTVKRNIQLTDILVWMIKR